MARQPRVPAADVPSEPWTPPLPAAVQRQVDRANALVANPQAVNGEIPDGKASSEVAGEQAVAVPGAPEPPPAEAPSPPSPPEEAAPTPITPDVNWEQRFNTLQGKYNSETGEMRAELRAMREMLQRQQESQYRPPPKEEIPPPPKRYDLPPEDVENYGQDLINASQRWAEAKYGPQLSELEQRLRQVESGNQQLNMMSVTQRCEAQLDQLIPGWRQVNVQQDFINWLAQVDPFSGRSRQVMINEAYGAGDANRTALFFQAYEREHTAVTPAPAGRQEARQEFAPAASQPLMDLVAPGRAQTAPLQAPGAPTKRMWTRDEINAFYNSRRRGYWRGREAEADAIEQDLINAQGEGRIRS